MPRLCLLAAVGCLALSTSAHGQAPTLLKGHTGAVHAVAFSPDGKWLASGSKDRTIRLWDAASLQEKAVLKDADDQRAGVRAVAFSPDGMMLAAGLEDGTVLLWDAASRTKKVKLHAGAGTASAVSALTFSPDGELLAVAFRDKSVKLWEVKSGKEKSPLKKFRREVIALAFAPDGKTLALGCAAFNTEGAEIKLWDVAGEKDKATLRHKDAVNALAFTRDPAAPALISASDDETIKLWDLGTLKERATLKGHAGGVYALALAADGKTLVSAGLDNAIKVWDIAGAKERSSVDAKATLNSIVFSPDGRLLAGVSDVGEPVIRVWEASKLLGGK